jgi:alpha-tubulin suppressor-like RCC1 family protein
VRREQCRSIHAFCFRKAPSAVGAGDSDYGSCVFVFCCTNLYFSHATYTNANVLRFHHSVLDCHCISSFSRRDCAHAFCRNDMGQTGNASISRNEFNFPLPVPEAIIVPGLSSGILSIGAGGYHSCAVIQGTAAGEGASAVCWGKNAQGQLGTGSTSPTFSISPLPVAGLSSGVASLAAGFQHTCALLINGSVCCWGSNDHGQLGLGFFSDANSPVSSPALVTGLPAGVVQVAVGGYHTCALIGDGSVFCWGRCIEAQMGDNTPPCTDVDGKPSPTRVSGLGAGSGVVKISAGNLHSCGVMSNGSAVCWGGESLSAVLSHGSQCFAL